MLKKKKAFTLVELLVAMAIIGVLIGLAIFGLAAAQRVQRDTERKSALDDMSVGMQVYQEKYNAAPTAINISAVGTVTFCNNAALCTGATQTVNVPLKGAGVALAVANTTADANLTTLSNTTSTGTAYCLVRNATATGTNPTGYAFCAGLENGQVNCSGTGAVKGNTVQCGTPAVTITIP